MFNGHLNENGGDDETRIRGLCRDRDRTVGWEFLAKTVLNATLFHHFLLLCTFARVPAGAFLFNLI
jgi:hypothetical protein